MYFNKFPFLYLALSTLFVDCVRKRRDCPKGTQLREEGGNDTTDVLAREREGLRLGSIHEGLPPELSLRQLSSEPKTEDSTILLKR